MHNCPSRPRLHGEQESKLENVKGLGRNSQVQSVIEVLGSMGYVCAAKLMTPIDFGHPQDRPRYYFVLVRQDRARVSDEGKLQDIAREVYGAATASRRGPTLFDEALVAELSGTTLADPA